MFYIAFRSKFFNNQPSGVMEELMLTGELIDGC